MFGGFKGETHFGIMRPACIRVKSQHVQGTTISNVRQLSVMFAKEIEQIAEKVGLDDIDLTLLGFSLILKGIVDFMHVPPSSQLK